MVEHINRVFRVGRKGYVIEIYPGRATHSPNSKYTIRIRRVYSDTQSFRLFLPPWKRGSISRIRLINERHKLAGLDGFSRETKQSVDLGRNSQGADVSSRDENNARRGFSLGSSRVPNLPQFRPFRTAFSAVGSKPPPPPSRARNTIYTGFLRIPFNSAHDLWIRPVQSLVDALTVGIVERGGK